MTEYKPHFSEEFADDLAKLDTGAKGIAVKVIKKILENPERSKKLSGPLAGYLRERFLQYRVIYKINEEEHIVEFIKLKKRDEAYR